jgi:hypothetical protein
LADGRLTAKTPVFEGWKSLDFLGFSRSKPDFSMGYTGFSLEENSRPLPGPAGAPERTPIFFGGRGAELFMGKLSSVSDLLQ